MIDLCRTAIVIPSFEPDKSLTDYVYSLLKAGFCNIIVIDDGSNEEYQEIFRNLEKEIIVLRHSTNLGKGAALKTGFRWILQNAHSINGIITADSDGQHTVEDCIKLAQKLGFSEKTLILGVRDFNLPAIPWKSRFGNIVTSFLFRLLYGQYISDTQTGLRAFGRELLLFMLDVPGDHYEYETKILIKCVQEQIQIVTVPIKTIYENNNEGSHFHPIRDSVKIYKVLFGEFLKFSGSSFISMIVDQGLFNLLNIVMFNNRFAKQGGLILASTVIARITSASVNYTLNKNLVFGKRGNSNISVLRYVILCICVMLLSGFGTWGLSIIGLSSTAAKILLDTMLYFLSYRFQRHWVFA